MSDKTDYELLCKEVEKIDMVAAKYLREEAPKIENFMYDKCLPMCFIFSLSPHGCKYWQNITLELPRPYGWHLEEKELP